MNKGLFKEVLNPSFNFDGEIALQQQGTLRKLVGVLGMLLPVIIYLFLQITDDFNPVLPSISHYYFTRSSSFFLIIVSALAIFLLIYKGCSLADYYISGIAGISALLMLLFPTDNLRGLMGGKFDLVAVTYFDGSDFRPKFHYACAAVFLLSLAYMSFFLFTKSDHQPAQRGTRKIIRNRIYRVCAIIMLAALLTAFAGFMNIIPEDFYDAHNLTLWMEIITVEAFGFSWLVKGGSLFPDETRITVINTSVAASNTSHFVPAHENIN